MPQLDIRLKSTADMVGIEAMGAGLQNVEQKINRAGAAWSAFGNNLAKKLRLPDLGRDILGGFGIGSGFAVAEKLAGLISDHFKSAAEAAQEIAASVEKQFTALEKSLRLRRTDEQEIAKLRADQARDQRALEALKAPRTITRTVGSIIRGDDFRRQVTETLPQTAEEGKSIASLSAIIQERAAVLDEMVKKNADRIAAETEKDDEARLKSDIENARAFEAERERAAERAKDILATRQAEAEAIRAKTTDEERYRQEVEKINELRGVGNGLTEAEANAAIARLDAERQMNVERAKERALSAALGQLEAERALVENNAALTKREQGARLLPLLQAENRLIEERLEFLTREAALSRDPQLVTQLQETIDRLRRELAQRNGAIVGISNPDTLANRDAKALRDLSDPAQHRQTLGEGVSGGAANFLTSIGTSADSAAAAVNGGLNSALTTTSDLMYNIVSGAMNFRDAWNSAILSIGQSFLRLMTDMVAKEVWRATVGRALVALGVTTHAAGETAKTAATTTGIGARLALVAKEAFASVVSGAVKAFEALASIPYVGPFLGAAAMAAALAGGVSLVSQIGHAEGGYTMRGPRDQPAGVVHAGEWIAPAWMVNSPRFAGVIAGLEASRRGSPGFAGGGFFGKDGLFGSNWAKKFFTTGIDPNITGWYRQMTRDPGSPEFSLDHATGKWASALEGANTASQTRAAESLAATSGASAALAGGSGKESRVLVVDHRDEDLINRVIADPRFETRVRRIGRRFPGDFGSPT